MKRVIQFVGIGLLAATCFFLVRMFFPDDAEVIRKQLSKMVDTASFEGEVSILAKASNAGKLAGYFAPNAHIQVSSWRSQRLNISGRAEIRDTAIGAMSTLPDLKLSISGIQITVAEDRSTATVVVSIIARTSQREEPWQQDLEVEMLGLDGDWLIARIGNHEFIKP